MAKYIRWFKQLSKKDIGLAGGKGANLGEMWNAGFPVPPGFVIIADAYRAFLAENKIDVQIYAKLKGLDIENNEKLQAVAKEIQTIILNGKLSEEMQEEIIAAYSCLDTSEELKGVKSAESLIKAGRDPVLVAVRSSATAEDLPTASFAGQQATLLNIKGNSQVIKAVQECWSSLFTARAIYYREKNNFPHMKVAIAVVIQKMINSEKSGVVFSLNPATNNQEQIVIESAWARRSSCLRGCKSKYIYY